MADGTIPENFPKSRAEAVACGSYHYFTGKPCKNGHIAKRILPGTCVECKAGYERLYRQRDPEKYRATGRRHEQKRLTDPIMRAKRNEAQRIPSRVERKRLGRIRLQERIAGRQKPSQCDICSKTRKIFFDHCHGTGKFRGWLCERCNIILGMAHDDPVYLRQMADYAERHAIPVGTQLDFVTLIDAARELSRHPARKTRGRWKKMPHRTKRVRPPV